MLLISMSVVLVDCRSSDFTASSPGLLPGLSVPCTTTGPPIVPVPASHAAAATDSVPEPSTPLTVSFPADTVVGPEEVLEPVSVRVPEPSFVRPPLPENTVPSERLSLRFTVNVPLLARLDCASDPPAASVAEPPAASDTVPVTAPPSVAAPPLTTESVPARAP